jgi:hypothetical protein
MGDYTAIIAYGAVALIVCSLGLAWKFVLRSFVRRHNLLGYRNTGSDNHAPQSH